MWIFLEVAYDPEGNEQKEGQSGMHQLHPWATSTAKKASACSLELLPDTLHSSWCCLIVLDSIDQLGCQFLFCSFALLDLPDGAL